MKHILAGAAAAVAVGASGSAAALEWSIEPSTAFRYDWTNNYRFLAGGSDPGWDIAVSPGFKATTQSATTAFTWTGNVSAVHSSVVDPRNRIDANTSLSWSNRDERNTYAATFTYVRDLTLASELTTTGYLTDVVSRNSYIFSPSYTRALTERWSFGISGSANWARYSRTGDNGLDNYNNYSVSPTLSYALTPQTRITGGIAGAWYHGTPIENRTTSYSATVGITHQYSERLNVAANVGYAHTHTQTDGLFVCLVPQVVSGQIVDQLFPSANCPVPLTNTGASDQTSNTPIYNLSATWNLSELSTVTGSASEAIIPSGLGSTLNAKSYFVGLSHNLTERLNSNVSVSLTDSKLSGSTGGVPSSQYRNLSASLSYRLSLRWNLDAGYRYSQIVFSGSPNLSQHFLYAALRYDFARMAFSQ